MDKLNFRIQRQNNLNDVYVSNESDDMFNGVHHKYQVKTLYCDDPHLPEYAKESKVLAEINFQKGPRKDPNSTHGVIESDLLEILRDRYKGHQASEYASRENAIILTHLEEALMWSAKRSDDRAERGVLGTTEK